MGQQTQQSRSEVSTFSARQFALTSFETGAEQDAKVDYRRLLRRYWPMVLVTGGLGVLLSLLLLVWQQPIYQTGGLLEVDALSASYRNNSVQPLDEKFAPDGSNLLTEAELLSSGPVTRHVVEKMSRQLSTWPPPPGDALAPLRKRLHRSSNQHQAAMDALVYAASTFKARPVNGTRLLEISCESTNPAIAAAFLNGVAQEFIDENTRTRSEAAQKTTEWLAGQLSVAKDKLKAAEDNLHTFLQRSGTFYATPDSTLDDSKLKQLQSALADAQARRIQAQARYETLLRSKPEANPEVNADGTVASLRSKLADLEEQKATLSSFTANYPKLKHIEETKAVLQSELNDRVKSVMDRLQSEYDAAVRQENLLKQAFVVQGFQVKAQAGLAADYVTVKRDVDNYRSIYDSLLHQMSQSEIGGSLPTTLVQMVQPCEAPTAPFKPKLGSMLLLGCVGGLGVGLGFAFLGEKKDRSVKQPGAVREILRVPELGVIPSTRSLAALPAAPEHGPALALALTSGNRDHRYLMPATQHHDVAYEAWDKRSPILAESFRATLTSLRRELSRNRNAKVILVTSARAGDGKTTMVANLGIALAETGKRVLVIDADFRRPRLASIFQVSDGPGLADWIEGSEPVDELMQKVVSRGTSVPGLFVVASGKPVGGLSKLLSSPRLPAFLEGIRDQFDFILCDAPPLLPMADSRLIAQMTDGVVLVVRAGSTDKASLQTVHLCLAEDGVPIIGTVLNCWEPDPAELRSYYAYYV
jgi:polysaccharide biosynthesis transport protein